jgi:hypothetical protein
MWRTSTGSWFIGSGPGSSEERPQDERQGDHDAGDDEDQIAAMLDPAP